MHQGQSWVSKVHELQNTSSGRQPVACRREADRWAVGISQRNIVQKDVRSRSLR